MWARGQTRCHGLCVEPRLDVHDECAEVCIPYCHAQSTFAGVCRAAPMTLCVGVGVGVGGWMWVCGCGCVPAQSIHAEEIATAKDRPDIFLPA